MKTANEIAQGGAENYPWKDEPDYLRFQDKDTDLYCVIRRNKTLGILCGYVEMPIAYPYLDLFSTEILDSLNVYGGVTYSEYGSGELRGDTFYIGFDCYHANDLMPAYFTDSRFGDIKLYTNDQVYRDIKFVKSQCKKLARQIYKITAQQFANDTLNLTTKLLSTYDEN